MPWGATTLNAPTAIHPNDPFTPMIRTYMGDTIRVKIQAGGHEEEHNASISGMKWLQGGSGHGRQPNSGWRSSQAAGISEQFTLAIPIVPPGRHADRPGRHHASRLPVQRRLVDGRLVERHVGPGARLRERCAPTCTRCRTTRIRRRRRTIANKVDFVGVCPVNAQAALDQRGRDPGQRPAAETGWRHHPADRHRQPARRRAAQADRRHAGLQPAHHAGGRPDHRRRRAKSSPCRRTPVRSTIRRR